MNVIWFGLLVPIYAVGLLIAGIAALIVLGHGAHQDPAEALPVLAACIVYFGLAFVVFGAVPRWMNGRLLQKVTPFRERGFNAAWELTSVALTTYVGIDRERGRLLYVRIGGVQREMPIADVSYWEVVAQGSHTTLRIHTYLADMPLFDLKIPRSKSNWCVASLRGLIG